MSNEHTVSEKDKRALAIAASVGEQVRKLVHANIESIETAALENDAGEGDKPIEAKLSFAVKWPAGSIAPNVSVGLSYTVKYKDESDELVDPTQMNLEMTE